MRPIGLISVASSVQYEAIAFMSCWFHASKNPCADFMTPSSAFMVAFFESAANADVASSRNSAAVRILFTLPPRLGFPQMGGMGLTIWLHHTTPAWRTAVLSRCRLFTRLRRVSFASLDGQTEMVPKLESELASPKECALAL